jgi:uncharacterized protein YgiB involved in biofilm formation
MKRSRKLELSLMGVAPLALSACSPSPENLVYENLSDCYSDPRVTQVACNDAYNRALTEHVRTAPHFASMDQCQATYGPGQCDIRLDPAGNPYYSPRMNGFMVGRWMPPTYNWYGHSYVPSVIVTGGDWAPRPLYRTASDWNTGGWSTAGGRSWGGSSEASYGSGGSRISTSTLERGGFGGSASARSSWGG